MKFKKALAVTLSALCLINSSAVISFAEDNNTSKTYNYVALGDSIGAGYGLAENDSILAGDPALILTEDLIANPVRGAYASIFGTYLEDMLKDSGYTVSATNLSSTAYRAEDVEKTILNDGYKGVMATSIFEGFLGKGSSKVLENYHNIYSQYLPNADLVSIQLGGNDMMMEIIGPMFSNENPILQATGMSLMLTLFGCDVEISIGAGIQIINNAKDTITYDVVVEAATYFNNVKNNATKYVDDSASSVKKVVEAVQTVNSDADIALLGMFNPYGNSLEYNGQVYDTATVIQNIFKKAVEEACDEKIKVDEVKVVPDEELTEEVKSCNSNIKKLENAVNDIEESNSVNKESLKNLLSIVTGEISYPMQYLLAGKNVEPQILYLNEKLKSISNETGAKYVDVYNISNENNLDPHPNAQGHKEIADIMKAELTPLVCERTGVEPPILLGDVNNDGNVSIVDAILIQRYLLGISTLEPMSLKAADMDGDNKVGIIDAVLIQKATLQ